jgi:hypothetical protein
MKMNKPKINDSFSKPKNWPTLIVTNVGWVFGFSNINWAPVFENKKSKNHESSSC